MSLTLDIFNTVSGILTTLMLCNSLTKYFVDIFNTYDILLVASLPLNAINIFNTYDILLVASLPLNVV